MEKAAIRVNPDSDPSYLKGVRMVAKQLGIAVIEDHRCPIDTVVHLIASSEPSKEEKT